MHECYISHISSITNKSLIPIDQISSKTCQEGVDAWTCALRIPWPTYCGGPQVVHCSPPILPPPFLHLLSRAWLIVGYAFFFPHCGIQRAFGYFLPVAGAPLIPAISATTTPMTTATDPHRCISCLCSAAAGAHTGALAVLSSENSELMARHLLEFIRPLAQPPGQSPELQAGQRNGISCWQNLRLVQEC